MVLTFGSFLDQLKGIYGNKPDPATGTNVLGSGGGMDVLGSLKANSDFATQYAGNPGGQLMTGPVAMSDKTKKKYTKIDDLCFDEDWI